MKAFLKKYKNWLFPLTFLLILAGIALAWVGLSRPIKIVLDGREGMVQTASLSVQGILRSAGIKPLEEDHVIAFPDDLPWEIESIYVQTAREILVKTPNDEIITRTTEEIPANILKSIEIEIFPYDQVLINGAEVDPHTPVEVKGSFSLQYKPADKISLFIDGSEQIIHTNEATLGAALESASIYLSPVDWISQNLSTPVEEAEEVTIRRAKQISVTLEGEVLTGLTSALTVGDALEDVGQPLQNLDYSVPPADSPLPEDGQIEIVRVNEELMMMTDEVPYENEWVEDPNALLDTISVVQPGQLGIYATRERIRYEGGEEVWRSPQETWQASQAQDGVLGYGTDVEVRTAVVDGQEIEYWRKITVYATSYSPCRSGIDGCSTGTATGIMPVQKGVIAVTSRWLTGYGMWGQSVYVQGYGRGTIADAGGGIPGTPWIDLAYSDEGYVPWSRWTTMYFLTPVPAWYPAIILP